MTTAAKVGARNDTFNLKEARRYRTKAANSADAALSELQEMRKAMGRPDYGRITTYISEVIANLSKTSTNLDEMLKLRSEVGLADGDLAERLQALEDKVARIMQTMGVCEEPLFPEEEL